MHNMYVKLRSALEEHLETTIFSKYISKLNINKMWV